MKITMNSKETVVQVKEFAKNQKGLTLVELLVVVTLIGLIAVTVASSVFSKGNAAKAELNLTRMESLKQEISRYRLTYNAYPTSLNDLVKPNAQVRATGRPFTSIIKEDELKDIWGNAYLFKLENDGRTYAITSLGSDGVQGGEGPDQDVTSRP